LVAVVADAAIHAEIRELFEGLVPVEVIEAYDRLVETDGCAKEEAERLVGDVELLSVLTNWGMAHITPHTPTAPALLRPASPPLALQGVLAGHQHRLVRDQEQLLAGHKRLAQAQARFGMIGAGHLPEHLISVVTDRDQISGLSASLINAARQDWMSLETAHSEMPLTEDFAQPPLPAFAGRVRCRAIYEAALLDDPAGQRIIDACTRAGEQARVLATVPLKMKLADRTTALAALTPSGAAAALVIKAPVIVAALRDYFELLWDRATPLPGRRSEAPRSGLTPAQQTILNLMAQGHADEAIAHRAGVSLTTVRRHISAIQDKLGVKSRFAAGAAAQRKGWIG
jgi:DNA-binding CsgD family transcriptional regulator